jgi:RimJ/RimL family protein N-acetyltransferase
MTVRLRADVTLAQLNESCAARILTWVQTPDVAEALGLSHIPTMERTLAWIEEARAREDIWAWAVCWRDEHVGNVVFDQLDRKAGTARLSVFIGNYGDRSQGVGTTAIYRALMHAFCSEHLYKVWLTVHTENIAAIRVYRKLGFQVEGILRGAFLLNGRRLGALYMGLLASEFHEMRRASEANHS